MNAVYLLAAAGIWLTVAYLVWLVKSRARRD